MIFLINEFYELLASSCITVFVFLVYLLIAVIGVCVLLDFQRNNIIRQEERRQDPLPYPDSNLQDQINQLTQEKRQLEQNREKLQELKQKQEAQLKKLTVEINQKKEENKKAEENIAKLKYEMKKKDDQNRTDTENLKTQIDRLTKENTKLRQEKTKLEKMQAKSLQVTVFKAQKTGTLSYYGIIKNYQTVETNYGGHFDPVTGYYTVARDGKYHVTFSHDHQGGILVLQHVKVSDRSITSICDNNTSPFDKGIKQATRECVAQRGDTLHLEGRYLSDKDVTVRFSVSYLG